MTQFQNTEGKCTFVARRHFHPWRWVNFHDGIWNEDDVHSIENTLNTHNSQATRRCNSQASVTHTQCYNLESHNVTYRCSSQASEWLTVRMPCQSPTSRLKSRTHTITSPSNITYKPPHLATSHINHIKFAWLKTVNFYPPQMYLVLSFGI